MSCTTEVNHHFAYYPFGNTPPVSLTQDLPPEQDADILLLGCGDVRNVLFTCFVDNARKIDVTCCDINPLIHARNVLIYSLLIDDTSNRNIERIWNIYYHWKLDEESVKLLETQTEKLLQLSKSIDQWHSSIYGSSIRFCDKKSLSVVRSYWMGFQLRGLSHSEKKDRLKQLQAAIDRAKLWRKKEQGMEESSSSGLRSASPIGYEVIKDQSDVANYWWDEGTMPLSRPSALSSSNLNPTLLYTPDSSLTLCFSLDPLLGIPVCNAFTPISKGSAFHFERTHSKLVEHFCRDSIPLEYLVNCAEIHFKQWASAFRKSVANKSVIRIFCGDALAFCFTLRKYQLKLKRSMNLPSDNRTTNSSELYADDYGHDNSSAPLSFDIVDTSNLVDPLGPLNVIPVTSTLLKYRASSTLYTEMLVHGHLDLISRLNDFFGVDVRTMSLLLGLVAPELFTNAMDSFEEDPVIAGLVEEHAKHTVGFARSRLRWRRLVGCQESGDARYMHIEGKELAKLLVRVHNAMFKHEDLTFVFKMFEHCLKSPLDLMRLSNTRYNRASFASLLSFIKANVISDWNQCIKDMYKSIFSADPLETVTLHYTEELLLNMHLCGVDNGRFQKPTRADVKDSILALSLPISEDVPDQLCITIQVPREKLKIFTSAKPFEMNSPVLACSFKDGDPDDMTMSCTNTFSTVRMAFGSWHEQTKEDGLYPYIEEDISQLSGTSDMFLSFMVPTMMLLQSKRSVPWVQCELVPTPGSQQCFSGKLGSFLCFARYKITSKNVFITRYMPGMSTLPAFALTSAEKDKPTAAAITLRLRNDGSKINTLIHRIMLESQEAKALLAVPSSAVEVKFKSPLIALVTIAKTEELEFKFPVPVSPSKYKIRIARKSSYIEIETPLFDPLAEDATFFLFPVSIMETLGATVPTLWTSTRIDLDVMPTMDLKNKLAVSWLVGHAYLMFSNREGRIHKSKIANPSVSGTCADTRTDLKDGLFSIFMHYAGLKCQQAKFFALSKMDNAIQALIFPSCLRLDLVNHTVVLDTALIPLTETVLSDSRAAQFIQELTDHNHDLCQVKVSEDENRAWKSIMPALVERCRTGATWKHVPDCEYIQAGEVPLPKGLSEDGVSPICSCGVGKFPSGGYLRNQIKSLPDLDYMISRYATRAAIAPVFAVPYVEECSLNDLLDTVCNDPYTFEKLSAEIKCYHIKRGVYNKNKCVIKRKCAVCDKSKREDVEASEKGLLLCSKCKLVSYCSTECQKADWKTHKPLCC